MKLVDKHEVIIDAREPLNWIDRVHEQHEECYRLHGVTPDKVLVTQEQLEDLKRQMREREDDYAIPPDPRPRVPQLWGIPVEVEK